MGPGTHLFHGVDEVLGRLVHLSSCRHSAPRSEEGGARSWVTVHFHRVAGLHGATCLVV